MAALVATLLAFAGAPLAFAQWGRITVEPNVPYDGRFTFVRVKYTTAPGGYWAGGRPSWVHGFPLAERNLMKIMNDISYLGALEDTPYTLDIEKAKVAVKKEQLSGFKLMTFEIMEPESESVQAEWENIHNKVLFDAVNEALDNFRPYGLRGPPLPWSQ